MLWHLDVSQTTIMKLDRVINWAKSIFCEALIPIIKRKKAWNWWIVEISMTRVYKIMAAGKSWEL